MNNNVILNNRWKYTESKLREYLYKYKKISLRTQDMIQDVFNDMNFTYQDLNKPISIIKRKKLFRIIEGWRDNDLLNGFFNYKVKELVNKTSITNEEMLGISLFGAFISERKLLDKLEKKMFINIGQNLYNQGVNEIKPKNEKVFDLTDSYILLLLGLSGVSGSKWIDYVEALSLTNSEEIKKQAMINMQQNKNLNIDDDVFQNIILKQQNKYLSINNDKYSGSLENKIVEIANQSFLKAGTDYGNKELQVRFISEIDKRTTKMCDSMNEMIFNVNDWNTFQRYSNDDGKIVNYKIFGLQVGINLPPINNHFHYCRSTITYLTDMHRLELDKSLQTIEQKSSINKWMSSDFYIINQKMYNGDKLTKNEKKLVKNLYRGLNKEPYYIAKEDEMIVRVLEVDNNIVNEIISNHQINKVYKSKAFESYSLKEDYNPQANVLFYVKDSKKARNMLKYNPIDQEAEVLYQYGTKFVTRDYYTKNDKHYFLLEEL